MIIYLKPYSIYLRGTISASLRGFDEGVRGYLGAEESARVGYKSGSGSLCWHTDFVCV